MRKRPTFKEKQFALKYVENGGNGTQAALDTYDTNSKDSAQVIASNNLDKPIVLEELNRILEKLGLNEDSYIAKKLYDSLESSIGVKSKNSDAVNILNMLLKIKNTYPASKHMSMKLTMNNDISRKDFNQVQETLKDLQDKTTKLLEEVKG